MTSLFYIFLIDGGFKITQYHPYTQCSIHVTASLRNSHVVSPWILLVIGSSLFCKAMLFIFGEL